MDDKFGGASCEIGVDFGAVEGSGGGPVDVGVLDFDAVDFGHVGIGEGFPGFAGGDIEGVDGGLEGRRAEDYGVVVAGHAVYVGEVGGMGYVGDVGGAGCGVEVDLPNVCGIGRRIEYVGFFD